MVLVVIVVIVIVIFWGKNHNFLGEESQLLNQEYKQGRDKGGRTLAEQKVIKTLGQLYMSGRREDWWMVVSGLLRRHLNIPIKDAINVCKNICEDMDDEEIGKRIKTTETTFTHKHPSEVASRGYFENFVKLQKNGLDKEELDRYVKNLERQVLSALFELELEVIQRDNPCWLW